MIDISEMRAEERRQPLEDGTILEYIVHGKFAFKESDINDTCGARGGCRCAGWSSKVGKEVVEAKLE